MSRVFVTSCILTSDLNTDVSYVLSELLGGEMQEQVHRADMPLLPSAVA